MKKNIALLLFLIVSCLSSYARKTVTIDNVTYEIANPIGKESYAIALGPVASSDSSITEELTLPEEIEFEETLYPVREIAEAAFRGYHIRSLVLHGSINTVGTYAFADNPYLVKITMEYGKKNLTIMNSSFDGCYVKSVVMNRNLSDSSIGLFNGSGIEEVTFGDKITRINPATFKDCKKLTSITIPGSVKSIGSKAFMTCDNLSVVTIKEGLTSIEKQAFYSCISLRNISLPSSINSLGIYLFSNCTSLQTIRLPEDIKSIPEGGFFNCSKLQTIHIPSTVTEIESFAFSHCTSLECPKLPSELRLIDEYAFSNCTNFKEITIPSDVEAVGSYAFYNCPFTKFILEDSQNEIEISSQCFGTTEIDTGKVVEWSGETIWETVTKHPDTINSFYLGRNIVGYDEGVSLLDDCDIRDFRMSPTLNALPAYFFANWTSAKWNDIKNPQLPSTVTSLGNYLFSDSQLETISIPPAVEKIPKGCFHNCTELESIILSPKIKMIDDYAFTGSGLKTITVMMADDTPTCRVDAFEEDQYAYAQLIVPQQALDMYKRRVPWKYFAKIKGEDFSALEIIDADSTIGDNTPVEWYNLSGVRVSGENLPAGIYIRRQGSDVTKVVIP